MTKEQGSESRSDTDTQTIQTLIDYANALHIYSGDGNRKRDAAIKAGRDLIARMEAPVSEQGTRPQHFDPEGSARWNAVRRAAEFAGNQKSDSALPGDARAGWNAACRYISEKLHAGESEKPPQRSERNGV